MRTSKKNPLGGSRMSKKLISVSMNQMKSSFEVGSTTENMAVVHKTKLCEYSKEFKKENLNNLNEELEQEHLNNLNEFRWFDSKH